MNIRYGIPIPDKAEEIQSKVAEEITRLSGLHVAAVHVIFRNVYLNNPKPLVDKTTNSDEAPVLLGGHVDEEYTDEF